MTRDELRQVLDRLSLRGNHLVLHAALSSLGELEGGPRTLCEVLIDAVGPSGTIVVPTFTFAETVRDLPSNRELSVPPEQHRTIAYHPDLPVSREIGVTSEAFRHLPGVLRSNHPTHSFAAWGRQAREMLSTQRDNNPLGPLKKLNVMQGQVLLLGTTLEAATAIHLAEERARVPYLGRRTALRINAGGYEERVVVENFPGCSIGFVKIEAHLDPAKVRSVFLPHGAAHKVPVRYLVNLASQLLENDPRLLVCDDPQCASCARKLAVAGGAAAINEAHR
jgi:aminoglycoside N3'-acetyltransferase